MDVNGRLILKIDVFFSTFHFLGIDVAVVSWLPASETKETGEAGRYIVLNILIFRL